MNRRIAWFGFATLLMAISLTGCANNNFTTGPIPGAVEAPYVFVESLNPPGFSPLVGFDISYVDSNGNYYLASTGYTTGILEINTAQMTSFTEPTILGGGKTNFVGALNPGYVILDTAHAYEGGPNGVLSFFNPKAPTLSDALGAEEVWTGDGANFVDQAPIALPGDDARRTAATGASSSGWPHQDAYAAAYTSTGQWMCNSSVQIYDTTNGEWHRAYTNGCFKTDEIAVDTVDKLVIISNPEEDPNLVTNPNSFPFPTQWVASGPTHGVPTAPFVSLISTVPSTPDGAGNYYQVVKQIAFDGTNGTPDARWSPITFLAEGFPGNEGGIEQPVYSAAMGRIYVAVPFDATQANSSNGAIAVINPTTFAVSKINLTNCSPDGMALGPDGKEVLVACNSTTGPQLINLQTGATINSFAGAVPKPTDSASLAIYNSGAGNMCDEAAYNPTTNVYVVACQFAYNNSLVAVIDAGTGLSGAGLLQTIPTDTLATSQYVAGAAHSVSTDPVTGAILVPLPMGDPLCQSWTANTSAGAGVGCLGVWAPQGSWLQKGAY